MYLVKLRALFSSLANKFRVIDITSASQLELVTYTDLSSLEFSDQFLLDPSLLPIGSEGRKLLVLSRGVLSSASDALLRKKTLPNGGKHTAISDAAVSALLNR